MTLPTQVTAEALAAKIVDVQYVVMPNGRTTICQLTMENGFTVGGESSCASVEKFNAQIGREYSHKSALDKAWAFETYLLAEDRHRESRGDINTLESLQQEARLKLVHELMEILGADDTEAIIEHVKRMVEKPPHNNVVAGGGTRAIQLDLLGAIAGALSRFGEAPETLGRVRDLIAKPGVELGDVAREASIAAGRNASVAPQLLYADILFTLEGAFGKLNLNAKGR